MILCRKVEVFPCISYVLLFPASERTSYASLTLLKLLLQQGGCARVHYKATMGL